MLNPILASVIRTVVPLLVALLTSWLVRLGIDPDPYEDLIAQIAGGVIAVAYYVAVRIFETYVKPRFGWLLGIPKQPTYDAPAAPSDESPTGAVATEDTIGVPAGDKVAVIPVDEPVGPVYDSPDDPAFGAGVGDVAAQADETEQGLVDHALGQEYRGRHE